MIVQAFIANLFIFVMQLKNEQTIQTIKDKVKEISSKFTWKHAVIVSVPLVIYLYPTPIIRLLMPLTAMFNKNHTYINSEHSIKQIVLTFNEQITLEDLKNCSQFREQLSVLKKCSVQEINVLELFCGKQAALFSSQIGFSQREQSSEVRGEILWNSFRLLRLENNNIQFLLIKTSQPLIRHFLLRFYKLQKKQAHKIPPITSRKVSLLRLDNHVGTYEHLTVDIDA